MNLDVEVKFCSRPMHNKEPSINPRPAFFAFVLLAVFAFGGSTPGAGAESNISTSVISQSGIALHDATASISGWVVKLVSKVWIQSIGASPVRALETLT